MPKLSVAAFATRAGVSRQCINQLIVKGELFRGSDRKMDIGIRENKQYLVDHVAAQGKVIQSQLHPEEKKIKTPAKPISIPIPIQEIIETPEVPRPLLEVPEKDIDLEKTLASISPHDLRNMTPSEVGKVARLESALKTRVSRQAQRRELVDRLVIQRVFGKIYMIEANELRTLGGKIAPDLAGILGIDDPEVTLNIEKQIDDEVLKSMRHIQRIISDFLEKIGGERI